MNILGMNINCFDLRKTRKNLENLIKTGYKAVYFNSDVFSHSSGKLKNFSKVLFDLPLEPFSAHNLQTFPEIGKKPETIFHTALSVLMLSIWLSIKQEFSFFVAL